jgi:succinate dehydrogenase/fumarate reductase flavoprotein subunit
MKIGDGRREMSRRQFVEGTARAGGTIAGASLLGACASSTTGPPRWDRETDVVIVGYGGAGAAAAITVSEEKTAAIILEKAPEPGGNTAVSSGGVLLPSDGAKTAQFLEATGLGSVTGEAARVFSETWVGLEDWFSGHGAQFTVARHPGRWRGVFPGAEALDKQLTMSRPDKWNGVGRDVFAFLAGVVEKRAGIEVMLETPALRLVQDHETRAILGVKARKGAHELNIRAKRAVILALGGFEANREMMATYVEEAPIPIAVGGTPYNTGDGIRMVMDVGADLWHMNGVEWARVGFKPPELPAAFWLEPKAQAWIDVNRQGRRFRDESDSYGHAKKHLEVFQFDARAGRWPNHPWYMVFDEKTRMAGPIIMVHRSAGQAPFATYNLARELHTWSDDNSVEIEKGWIHRGGTIQELAGSIACDPAGLAQTVTRYNAFCRKGADEDFGRSARGLAAIDRPPYYAVECVVNTINTQGGPRRNHRSQVLDPYGAVIPRLYAVGEFGSLFGFLYPGGCNLPECVVSGILAGRSAAAEKPV